MGAGQQLRVEGNYIGTNAAGTGAVYTSINSIGILVGESNNTIGGTTSASRNVISGNGNGVRLLNSTGNVVEGNYIGTDVTGSTALANSTGVYVFDAPQNIIGGTNAGAGNLIAGNSNAGINITGPGNLVQGNLIGLAADGTTGLANQIGVVIAGVSGNIVGGDDAADGTVDGVVKARNYFGLAQSYEIEIGPFASGNTIQGNYIGTDKTGTLARAGTSSYDIYVEDGSPTTIGGTSDGAGNVIAGAQVGIAFDSSSNGAVEGNWIGTNPAGTTGLGNVLGVEITNTSSGNIVGGTMAGQGNTIAFNASAGVEVGTSTADA